MKIRHVAVAAAAVILSSTFVSAQNQTSGQAQQTVAPQGQNSAGAVTNAKKPAKHAARKTHHHVASARSHHRMAKNTTKKIETTGQAPKDIQPPAQKQ